MNVNQFVELGQKLASDAQKKAGREVIFEPAGKTLAKQNQNRDVRQYHFRVPEGTTRTVPASIKWMSNGHWASPVWRKGHHAHLRVSGRVLSQDTSVTGFTWVEGPNWGRQSEWHMCIFSVWDFGYRNAVSALASACKAC